MQVIGDKVFVDGAFQERSVSFSDGIINEVSEISGAEGKSVIDARGGYVVPGFIDLHFHGAMGADFCDAKTESIATIARYEAAHGVTAICPATMTYTEEILTPVMDAAAAFQPADDESALVGINLEGPFISPDKVGAQNPAYVQNCDAGMVRRLNEHANGLVKLVDIAPEEQGALEFTADIHDEVRVSIAHTCADYETSMKAFEAGARHLTHTFNAMPGLHHRKPGPIGAAADFIKRAEADDFFAELICDGKHVDPAMVRLLFTLLDGRICAISDSMMAAGLDDGDYTLGGQDVQVHDSLAWLNPETIAGGVTNVGECLRRLVVEMGVEPAAAVKAASENPARALGIFDERGSLETGKVADMVILNEDFTIRTVILRGKVL